MLTIEQLRERILEKYDGDVEAVCDLLHVSVEDLLEMFCYRIEIHRDNFASEEYFEEDDKLSQEIFGDVEDD